MQLSNKVFPTSFGTAMAVLFFSALGGTAKADIVGSFGVSVFANAVANDGCAVNGTYATPGGRTSLTVTNFGAGPSTEGFVNCGTSFSSPTAPGLTSASFQANAQDTSRNDSFGHAGSATAAADLSSASLHSYSFSAGIITDTFHGTGQGSSSAQLWDTLTFAIPGATNSTVTNIPVYFTADGTSTRAFNDEEAWGASLQFSSSNSFCCNANEVTWEDDVNGFIFPGDIGLASDTFTAASDPFPDSINWLAPLVNTQHQLTEEGILSLTGPSATVHLLANLNTVANIQAVDFSNTAGISFQLPSGVSYTSASGVFGATSVPEPSTFGLCAVVLAGFGIFRRRLLR